MDVISTLTYLATGKMQLCRSDDLGLSQPSISKVITQTFIALSELYYVLKTFPIYTVLEVEKKKCRYSSDPPSPI